MTTPPSGWEAPTCRGRGVSLCFLPRGLSHTWGSMASGSGFFGGWLTIISFHLEKSFGIVKDNCVHVKARLGGGSRLYPINNMCILRFGLPRSGKPSVPPLETQPSPTAVERVAQPTAAPVFPLPAHAALVLQQYTRTTVSSGTSSGKSSSKTCGTRGRPHIHS